MRALKRRATNEAAELGSARSERISIKSVNLDPRAQPREAMDEATIVEYTAAWQAGAKFPEIIVYENKSGKRWLADGWHRILSRKGAGFSDIDAEIRPGDLREAILHAVGSNAKHGLPRSNRDKRRAVEILLDDPEWSRWSDREIARQCEVTHPFVANVRGQRSRLNVAPERPAVRKAIRGGKEYEIQTGKIGKAARGRSSGNGYQMEKAGPPARKLTADERKKGKPLADEIKAIDREIVSLEKQLASRRGQREKKAARLEKIAPAGLFGVQ